MTSVADVRKIPATPHPGLSWQERSTGHFKEQVNSMPSGQIERGNLHPWLGEAWGADPAVVVLKLL